MKLITSNRIIVFLLFVAILFSLLNCKSPEKEQQKVQVKKHSKTSELTKKENREILIQPFTDLPVSRADYVYMKIKEIMPNAKLLPAVNLPAEAFYKPRNRYRADTLIHWLKKGVSTNQVVVGITSKDISTTKHPNPDSGIMGLGFINGPSCVVSTFRLKKGSKDQLVKTVLHELGHNYGLSHCLEKTCFMRDAEGKNPLDEETGFCPKCKKVLVDKGWKL